VAAAVGHQRGRRLDRDLRDPPARHRGEEELPDAGLDLLAALAWEGGLPAGIWPVAATALSLDDACPSGWRDQSRPGPG
jgi:hypothetical protein